MLMLSLLLTGCSGGDEGASQGSDVGASMSTPQQTLSAQGQSSTLGMSSAGTKFEPSRSADATAVPSIGSPDLAQLSALPHLSSLSEREKAGLLMLLPSKSSSQRLALIDMYPSLVELPVQQKQVLLDQLEKIVPAAAGQPR
jgi:hypothetical protein